MLREVIAYALILSIAAIFAVWLILARRQRHGRGRRQRIDLFRDEKD